MTTQNKSHPTHRLTRQVRFSINPFLNITPTGFNSYSSKPAGEGLCIYLALRVCLNGPVNNNTGFIVNVSDIDKTARQTAVPIFENQIKKCFSAARHMSLETIVSTLKNASACLSDKFKPASLEKLTLDLNPFRSISTEPEDCKMICFSEKFEFAAMHTLWNNKFSREKNAAVFGKCANPAGHGHNYIIDVTVELTSKDRTDFSIATFEKTVEEHFLKLVDHRNLNIDVPAFADRIPTVENITALAWDCLNDKFENARLKTTTVWENDRTSSTCSI